MSKITVTTIAGATSGADANKVKIESGDDFNVVSGKVGIGTVNAPSNKNNVTPSLNVSGSGVNGAAQITRHTSVGVGGALLHLSGTRGSDVNSYTIVQNNDGIGTVSFQGADGNEFVQGAAIQANVDGTPGDNDMPTRLGFFVTADGASTSTERMRIHNGGVVSFNNGIELGSGLDATAANVLDDYEEGTWTAQLIGSTTNPSTAVTESNATYTKIGRLVFAQFQFSNVNTTGASGGVRVSGLPFAAAMAHGTGNVMTYVRMTFPTTSTNISPYVSGTDMSFYTSTSNQGWAEITHNAGTGAYLAVTVTYQTNA